MIERQYRRPVGRRVRPARADERLREPEGAPAPDRDLDRPCFAPGLAALMRPLPGLDTRVWDHDPASLFANVYRLGPRAEFDAGQLLRHLESIA